VCDGKPEVPGLPWVFGHEGGGDVVEVGSEVTNREVGQRVVIEPNYADGTCVECRRGHTSACVNRVILAINTPGILAARAVAPAEYTWPVPETWTDVQLACFEPLCVADTAVRRAQVPPGTDCLVIGAGSQGQLVCQSLLAGSAQPYVTEPHEGRLELVLSFGAKRAEEREGDRYPFVFETAGVTQVWNAAFNAVANFGMLVVVGMNPNPVQFTTLDLVNRKMTIVGQHIYDHPQDFQATLDSEPAGFCVPNRQWRRAFPRTRRPMRWLRSGRFQARLGSTSRPGGTDRNRVRAPSGHDRRHLGGDSTGPQRTQPQSARHP
jgi:threonine dehydrogenase-like Zn-dependent dehydrogenase